jgi:uncharacterized protein
MDTILLVVGFVFMVIGIFGSFLPVLPGPTISWVGLLLLYLTKSVENNYWILGISLVLTLVISLLDYFIPAKGTKYFGGSKYGVWGTNIGMIVGFFIPIPFGFILGAFLGAFIGELLFDKAEQKKALKAATGSLLGLLVSSFMKFIFCMIYLGLYIVIVWQNRSNLF